MVSDVRMNKQGVRDLNDFGPKKKPPASAAASAELASQDTAAAPQGAAGPAPVVKAPTEAVGADVVT